MLAAVFMLQLSACQSSQKKDDDKKEPDAAQTQVKQYTEKWVLSPSIKAQSIYSLPIVSFNESTNHYDVTYGDYYAIQKGGKFGLIDSNGKFIFEPEFASIETCPCYKGYIVTVQEGAYYTSTYHISEGNQKLWAYPHECKGFTGYSYLWNDASSKIMTEYSGTDSSAAKELKPVLPEAMQITDGNAPTGKYVIVNGGKAVSAKEFTGAGVFTGGLVALESKGKWGYVDSLGNTVIPFEFDAVENYSALKNKSNTPYECSEGYITVFRNGRYGIYNVDGEEVIPCQYTYLTTVHDGRAFASEDGRTWGILLVDEKISNGIKSVEASTSSAAA